MIAAVRFASLFWLLFSSGGVLLLLLASCAWLFLRPRSPAPRIWLLAVVLGYTAISTYPIPHGLNHWWASGFSELTKPDVPPGRVIEVLLGSGSYTAMDWSDRRAAVPS